MLPDNTVHLCPHFLGNGQDDNSISSCKHSWGSNSFSDGFSFAGATCNQDDKNEVWQYLSWLVHLRAGPNPSKHTSLLLFKLDAVVIDSYLCGQDTDEAA